MKTTILIRENRTQLVLKAETKHEEEVLKMLEKLPNTHRCDLFDTQGGFTRGYMNSGQDLMIVFDKPVSNEPA